MEKEQFENKIKEAQQLLKTLNNIDLAEAHKEARKHIGDHFDKLIKTLVERRDQLWKAIDDIFKQTGTYLLLL